jgi:hypothetical protein
MATNTGTAFNKSAAIREVLAEYPNKGPADLARLLYKKHGIKFRPNSISTLKSRMAKQSAAAPKPAVRTTPAHGPAASNSGAAAPGIATMVVNLQGYIRRVGKDDLHRLIDTL